MDKKKWVKPPHPDATNLIRSLDDRGFLSYNQASGRDDAYSESLTALANTLIALMPDGERPEVRNGDEETALCDSDKHIWCILKGDWRHEYDNLPDNTWATAHKFYLSHLESRSTWSVNDE